jgi:hypothetical protein
MVVRSVWILAILFGIVYSPATRAQMGFAFSSDSSSARTWGISDSIEPRARTEEIHEIPADTDKIVSAIVAGHHCWWDCDSCAELITSETGACVCGPHKPGCTPQRTAEVEGIPEIPVDPRLVRLAQENPGVFVGMGNGGPLAEVADAEEIPEIPDQRRYNAIVQGTCSGC